MEIKHYNIIVSGHVQGVGFRFSARKMAQIYGIKGFVKNNYDGSVYIEAEGNVSALNQFIGWCKNGPSNARVKDINVDESLVVSYNDFSIRH